MRERVQIKDLPVFFMCYRHKLCSIDLSFQHNLELNVSRAKKRDILLPSLFFGGADERESQMRCYAQLTENTSKNYEICFRAAISLITDEDKSTAGVKHI
jgi:hypothetical protein